MISSMLVLPGTSSGHSCAKRREVPRSQGRDVLSAEAPARNFVRRTAAARMLRGKFVVGNPDPKGVRCGERSRTSKRRRAREQHRASDRGRAGKKLEEWRSYRNCPQTGATAQDALQETTNDQTFCLAAVQATTYRRMQCADTKPHSVCNQPRDRARHGRQRRRYAAASIRRYRQVRRKQPAPHGTVRHRWVASATGASFRCSTISWTVAMRSPIQRMTGTAIELPSAR